MAADANIFAQYLQPVRSMGDRLAALDQREMAGLQLEGQRQQNAFLGAQRASQLDALNQSKEDENVFRGLASQAPNTNVLIDALERSGRSGLLKRAQELRKSLSDFEDAKVTRRKNEGEDIAKRLSLLKTLASSAFANPTPGAPMAIAAEFEKLTGIKWPEDQTVLASLQTPEQVRRWAAGHSMAADKLLPTIQNVNTGKVTETRAVDALTGIPTVTGTATMTTTPDADLQATTSEANNRRTVSASYANAAATRETANATRDAAKITARAAEAGKLRQEFADLPEVKKYKQAAPAYQAVVQAAKSNNPQADINLIYGLAKLYDPESVVREGEYGTIANSQAIPEWLKGQAQRLVGGGRLTEATKKQIIEQAKIRHDSFKGDMDGARGSYNEIAKRRDLNPDDVFPTVGGGITVAKEPTKPAAPAGKAPTVLKFDANGNPVP
jgi:hypothetical protein